MTIIQMTSLIHILYIIYNSSFIYKFDLGRKIIWVDESWQEGGSPIQADSRSKKGYANQSWLVKKVIYVNPHWSTPSLRP